PESALRVGAGPQLAVTAYQSLPGLFTHLFRYDRDWNPAPLVSAPTIVPVLVALSTMALVGLTFWFTWRADPDRRRTCGLAFAACAVLGLVLSPLSLDYHYPLLLAPIAILLAHGRDTRPGPAWWLLTAAGVLLV